MVSALHSGQQRAEREILWMRRSTSVISAPPSPRTLILLMLPFLCLCLTGSQSGDEVHVDKLLTSGKIPLDGVKGETTVGNCELILSCKYVEYVCMKLVFTMT